MDRFCDHFIPKWRWRPGKADSRTAYEDWFKTTDIVKVGDTTIFEYIKGKLEEENIKCGIFYNDEVKDQFE